MSKFIHFHLSCIILCCIPFLCQDMYGAGSDPVVVPIQTPNINTGDTIRNSRDSVETTLQEVVIEADRIIMKGKTTMLFPTRRDKRFAAGGIDVLWNMNIPDIIIDPMTRNVTVGGESVAMFIDFQPASDQQMSNIRPQDIERIDIIRSPDDPRFQNARVVANYILKKYLYGGYTKLDGTQMFTPYNGKYNLYSKFSYKRMTYDISAGTSYFNEGNEIRNKTVSHYSFSSGNLKRNSSVIDFKSRSVIPVVTGRAVYNSRSVSISNTVGLNYNREHPSRNRSEVKYSGIFESATSDTHSDSRNKGLTWNGNYYFALPSMWSLNFNGNFNWSENSSSSTYTLQNYTPIINDISERLVNTSGFLNLGKKLGRHNLNIFAGGGWSRNKLDYVSSNATPLYYREAYGQAGVSMNIGLNNVNLSPSVRLSLSSQKINGMEFTRCLPKAFVPFYIQLGKVQSLNGSFEFAIGNANTSDLSPVLVRRNEVDAVRGNENLDSYTFYNSRLGYSHYFGPWLRARADVSFNFQNNIIVPVYNEEMSPDGTPMMVRDVTNDGSISTTKFTLNLSGEYFQRKLTVNLSAGARYFAQRGERRRDVWAPDFNINASYYLGDFRISAYFVPETTGYSQWNDLKNAVWFYISGAWSWKDLYVDLRISNPFRKSYRSGLMEFNSDAFSTEKVLHSNAYHQAARLTVSYSFGYGKKLDRRDEVRDIGGSHSIILK